MSHGHHENCCKHENIKYCAVCKVVYCRDCKKEWVENWDLQSWYKASRWSPPWVYTTITSGKITPTDIQINCEHD